MQRMIMCFALLMLAATPALGKDPNFDIEAYCNRYWAGSPKESYEICIKSERAIREDVRRKKISDAAFQKCLAQAKKEPNKASYAKFMVCTEAQSD